MIISSAVYGMYLLVNEHSFDILMSLLKYELESFQAYDQTFFVDKMWVTISLGILFASFTLLLCLAWIFALSSIIQGLQTLID